MKTRAEIHEIQNEKIKKDQTKNLIFEKMKKIDKSLARLIKKQEKQKISKVRNEKKL